jgi:hypothetical protein
LPDGAAATKGLINQILLQFGLIDHHADLQSHWRDHRVAPSSAFHDPAASFGADAY